MDHRRDSDDQSQASSPIARATVGRGVELTRLGFGAAPIGNLHRSIDDATATAAVHAAWAAGIRYFDTAPHYGLGLSERRLGQALADRAGAATISTKVGRLLEPNPGGADSRDDQGFDVPATLRRRWDFSADGVRRTLESSLERLGVDHVDMVFIHDPDEHWRPALTEAYPALHELREQGVIRAIGAGMNQWQMLRDFVRETDMDVVMLAGRYTLLEQPALDELLPLCVEKGVKVMNVGVFNSGLLARPHPPAEATYNYQTAPPAELTKARRIAQVCERHGVTLPQAALAFAAAHPAVASVVIGARTAEQITENARLFAEPVPDELWTELVHEGMLRPDAPTKGAE